MDYKYKYSAYHPIHLSDRRGTKDWKILNGTLSSSPKQVLQQAQDKLIFITDGKNFSKCRIKNCLASQVLILLHMYICKQTSHQTNMGFYLETFALPREVLFYASKIANKNLLPTPFLERINSFLERKNVKWLDAWGNLQLFACMQTRYRDVVYPSTTNLLSMYILTQNRQR